MAVRSHRDLLVWQKAMDLVVTCYALTKSFPDDERFGLTSQLRRAIVSVPANIAEGRGRAMTGAYLNHLSIASGSLAEVDTHLGVANRLGYISNETLKQVTAHLEEVGRMLMGLRNSLATGPNS
ncbi:MAG: four helix bundle protein [Planctomycetaceae bacterium]|nr:four helix bundle protein [Planctomycetaceae bacterium]